MGLCGICILLIGMYQYGIFDSAKTREYEKILAEKEKEKITIDSEFQDRIKNIVKKTTGFKQETDQNGSFKN